MDFWGLPTRNIHKPRNDPWKAQARWSISVPDKMFGANIFQVWHIYIRKTQTPFVSNKDHQPLVIASRDPHLSHNSRQVQEPRVHTTWPAVWLQGRLWRQLGRGDVWWVSEGAGPGLTIGGQVLKHLCARIWITNCFSHIPHKRMQKCQNPHITTAEIKVHLFSAVISEVYAMLITP